MQHEVTDIDDILRDDTAITPQKTKQPLTAAALRYLAAGLVAVPENKLRKCPVTSAGMNATWKTVELPEAKERWTGTLSSHQDAIGILCGKRSGGLEVLDFDFGGIKYQPWADRVPADLLARLVIERSPSGGYHVAYRCPTIDENIHLAKPPKPADTTEHKAWIETRGEGGNIMVFPSPGYTLLQNDWAEIPTITPDERDTLISAARSLTEFIPEPKKPKSPKPTDGIISQTTTSFTNDIRPGERFNREASFNTTMAMLEQAGWTDAGGGNVTRPGKDSGVSGGIGEKGGFHCFTTSNADFSGGETYTPFAVYAILNHRGDYSAAGKELREKYGGAIKRSTSPEDGKWESDAETLISEPVAAPTIDFSLPAELQDRLPLFVRHLTTWLAKQTCGTIDARHIMMAIAGYAAMLGKRVSFHNWGVDYYINLATVILSASGTGKSNLKTLLANWLREHMVEVSDLTTATAEGVIGQYAISVPSGAADKIERRRAAREETAKQPGVTIMTDELLALTGSILREQEAAKYARLLCKLLDNDTISTLTKKDGLAIWHDQCVNIIGLSQVDSFDGALRTPAFKEAGLSGRIIPVNDKMAKWSMTPCDGNVNEDAARVMQTGDFKVHFGKGDSLGDAIARIERIATEQIPVCMDDWQQIRSKILIYGAKVAAVLAVIDHIAKAKPIDPFAFDQPDTEVIDASKWAAVGMALVHSCHASNLYYVGVVGEQHTKIKKVIEIKGPSTKRDICKYTGWESYVVAQLLNDLIDSGDIHKVPTGRTIRFQLVK